ncbi:MAG: NUDIX domain-containing protein [Bacteroidia bacterium]|nr:NUDIX domain-containing protein [Bacteroidia bacterium]
MTDRKFNIRVYGIHINKNNKVLVSDEYFKETYITKFPGGGLEYGEGTKECLLREWKEELNADIEILDHLYTTDFFQKSAFGDSQIISVYYLVQPSQQLSIEFKTKPFDFDKLFDGVQVFRWISLDTVSENDFTFPIDQQVIQLIKTH